LENVRGLEGDKSRLSAFNLQYRSQVENLKSEIKEMQERISSEEKRKR
jgi:gas vesicle protein